MENSWHQNVVDHGLVSLGASMAARMLIGGETWLTDAHTVPDSPFRISVTISATADSPFSLNPVFVPSTSPHFPYGYAVIGP